jgi:hypothetical protein
MAIIRPTRKNSGVETLIKILALLTEDVELERGQVLMSQFNHKGLQATKMSLFIHATFSYVGARNVWLQDYTDGVMVYYATEQEAIAFLQNLETSDNYETSIPAKNKMHYQLCSLDVGAEHIRNFLLVGAQPDLPIDAATKAWLNRLLKATVWDVLATFDPVSDVKLFV